MAFLRPLPFCLPFWAIGNGKFSYIQQAYRTSQFALDLVVGGIQNKNPALRAAFFLCTLLLQASLRSGRYFYGRITGVILVGGGELK